MKAPGSKVAGSLGANLLGMTSSGWVSITWYCSKKASWASFQLTGSTKASHHSVRMASTFQASQMVAKGSMQRRSAGACSSRLIHAQPPQSSQRTGTRSISPAARLCSENDFFLEMKVFLPSRP
jgi:hypothetical protein